MRRAALVALIAIVAHATPASACQQWKVPDVFLIKQDDRYEVTFQLRQNGSKLWGYARYATNKRTVTGNVTQAGINGNHFAARVMWTYSGVSSIGRYLGVIDPSGYLHGNVYDDMSAKPVSIGWYATPILRCDDPPAAPPKRRPWVEHFKRWQQKKPAIVTDQAMPALKDKLTPSSPSPSGAVMQFPTNRPRPVN